MKRSEYMIMLAEAVSRAGLETTMVRGDQMSAVAMHLPTETLRAVIKKEVMHDENSQGWLEGVDFGTVSFHVGWIQACDDELTDRILTDNAT